MGGKIVNEENESTVTLNDVFRVLFRKWWIIILSTILCALLAFGATCVFTKKQYKATCKMYVYNSTDRMTQTSLKNEDFNASNKIIVAYSEILKMDNMYKEILSVAELENKYDVSGFGKMLSCGSVKDTPIFYISVTCTSSQDAIKLANTAIEIFPVEAKKVVVGSDCEVIAQAVSATELDRGFKKHAVIGAILGFVVSCGVILIVKYVKKIKREKRENDL